MNALGRNLYVFTVYDHPTDFPDHFVVRRFKISSEPPYEPIPDCIFMQEKSLMVIRDYLSYIGLYKIPRDPNDDPKIVESWI